MFIYEAFRTHENFPTYLDLSFLFRNVGIGKHIPDIVFLVLNYVFGQAQALWNYC